MSKSNYLRKYKVGTIAKKSSVNSKFQMMSENFDHNWGILQIL